VPKTDLPLGGDGTRNAEALQAFAKDQGDLPCRLRTAFQRRSRAHEIGIAGIVKADRLHAAHD